MSRSIAQAHGSDRMPCTAQCLRQLAALALAAQATHRLRLLPATSSPAIRAARRHLAAGAERAGRSLANFPVVFVVTLGLGPDAGVGAQWVRSWFAPGQPFLAYPSAANLRWLGEAGLAVDEAHDPAAIPEARANQIADAFGLFGSPERCADRLLRAHEEAGIDNVFLFRRTISRTVTTCQRPRSRRSTGSSALGSTADQRSDR